MIQSLYGNTGALGDMGSNPWSAIMQNPAFSQLFSNSVAPIDPKYLSGISPEQLRIMQMTGAAPQGATASPQQGGAMANPSTPVTNTQQTASSLVPQTSIPQMAQGMIPQGQSMPQGNNLAELARQLVGSNSYRSGRGYANPGMNYQSMMDMLMRRYYGNQGRS